MTEQSGITIVPADKLRDITISIFQAVGLSEEHAAIVADALVEADLRGVHSHGVMRIPQYLGQIPSGAINPRPQVRLVSDNGATALFDGDAGLGHIVSTMAMATAIEKARAFGIGAVGVGNSSHNGAAAHYAIQAISYDMIGFATTNCGASMAPPGGVERKTGNNPIAYAIPAGDELPIVLDMALSVVAGGKLMLAAKANQKIPLGWATDSDGNPTDDPVAGLKGMLTPIGGYKGYGLALIMDVFCGLLTGSDYGVHLGDQFDPTRHENAGHFFMAIDVSHFVSLDTFKRRVDEMIREIRATKPAPGVERVYLPGEIEWLRRRERIIQGIPLSSGVYASLQEHAARLGVSIDW